MQTQIVVFTVHLILTQYYTLYRGERASLVTLIFREFAVTKLLKRDANRVFYELRYIL